MNQCVDCGQQIIGLHICPSRQPLTLKEPGIVVTPRSYEALAEENAKLRADVEQHNLAAAEILSLKLQIRAAEPVIGAARLMVKHQADRHELSSCCNDVTPTNAYLLRRALAEWDTWQKTNIENRKCKCVWLDGGHVGMYRDNSVPCPVHDNMKY